MWRQILTMPNINGLNTNTGVSGETAALLKLPMPAAGLTSIVTATKSVVHAGAKRRRDEETSLFRDFDQVQRDYIKGEIPPDKLEEFWKLALQLSDRGYTSNMIISLTGRASNDTSMKFSNFNEAARAIIELHRSDKFKEFIKDTKNKEAITHIFKNIHYSNIEKMPELFEKLQANGFTMKQILEVRSDLCQIDEWHERLEIIQIHFEALKSLGLSHNNILSIIITPQGKKNLKALADKSNELKELGFLPEHLVAILEATSERQNCLTEKKRKNEKRKTANNLAAPPDERTSLLSWTDTKNNRERGCSMDSLTN